MHLAQAIVVAVFIGHVERWLEGKERLALPCTAVTRSQIENLAAEVLGGARVGVESGTLPHGNGDDADACRFS